MSKPILATVVTLQELQLNPFVYPRSWVPDLNFKEHAAKNYLFICKCKHTQTLRILELQERRRCCRRLLMGTAMELGYGRPGIKRGAESGLWVHLIATVLCSRMFYSSLLLCVLMCRIFVVSFIWLTGITSASRLLYDDDDGNCPYSLPPRPCHFTDS